MTPARQAVSAAKQDALSEQGATETSKQKQMADAIRALAMDAVQKANSGHPGMPMGMADVATVLFTKFLKFDPTHPRWPDRDRFVLSAGHGSMLLYASLYLLGYEDITIEEIKNFRQLGSRTAGHPEFGAAAGIETTTGPLGQGLATAVGMAIAERILSARFGSGLVDHRTYVIASDGDLMEGISHEAISIAGHLRLSRLVVLFDDNGISIDGPLSLAESGDQIKRFEAAGWAVERVDGHDPAAIEAALARTGTSDRPSMIACRTIIGYGAPNKQGSSSTHGAPLGADEVAAARRELGWTAEPFEVPCAIRDAWRIAGLRGCKVRKAWDERLAAADVSQRIEFTRCIDGELPVALAPAIADLKRQAAEARPALATRAASQRVLDAINAVVPETIGGSADLTGSNNTRSEGMAVITADDFSGRFIHYGVREHGMAATMNGMALHGGVIPYSGTFLVFSDYCRPSIRLAALMHQRVIHVMTHDSIGLGEDGPTHQPVEHLASLRAIPNLLVFRPADLTETAECWQLALGAETSPSVLALTRQNIAALRTEFEEENLCARGAYEIASAEGDAAVTIFASGSEVEIALAAKAALDRAGHAARVVSVPCFELFAAQSQAYRTGIIGDSAVKVAVEAAIRLGWDEIIGTDGIFVGMSGFGASAPAADLYAHFGITAEAIVDAATARLDA
jgi:transketolase